METEDGVMSESQVIMDYIEARYPQPALVPADPFAGAKVRELVTFLELHIELVARELYGEAFFGGKLPDDQKERIGAKLKKNVAGFAQLAKFAPYVAGDSFTMADCAAIFHLRLASAASAKVLGEDVLASLPLKEYLTRVEQMPNVQAVNAARAANLAAFAAAHKR